MRGASSVRTSTSCGRIVPCRWSRLAELQAWIDTILAEVNVPYLGVFGRPITDSEREFERLPDVQLEEWAGDGHFVHLVDPDRFATRLRRFVDHCTTTG
jgi:pimeloyl-ACP methyl ester carboxylesterase